jgi:hypothetical protein
MAEKLKGRKSKCGCQQKQFSFPVVQAFSPFQTTVRRLRPLRRREASTLRPPEVALRARKPILRARFLRWGRNVGCMIVAKKEGQGDRRRWGVSRTGLAVFRSFTRPKSR